MCRNARMFGHMKTLPVRPSPPLDTSRLLSRKELSGRWSLSTETLKRRERAGILSPLKLGKGVRYRLSAIERLEADAEARR